jgi:anti-sigma regulatory factor (Ser/Thr protein kinase)
MLGGVTPAGGSGDANAPAGQEALLTRRCLAEPGNLRAMRVGVDEWLAGLVWPEDAREDVVLAVNEACTNAVDHAYPAECTGEVAIFGRLRANGQLRQVLLLVRDWGRWRRPPADPGYRGHGLTVMRECMDKINIHRDLNGTAVAMTSCAVPNIAAATGLIPGHPMLRRSTPNHQPRIAVTVSTASAVDRAVGERRHRHAAILHRAGQLRAEAASHVSDAETARRRAQALMSTSTRVIAASRHICTSRGGSNEAA